MDESGLPAIPIMNRSESRWALIFASLYINAWHDMHSNGLAGKYASCKAQAHSEYEARGMVIWKSLRRSRLANIYERIYFPSL